MGSQTTVNERNTETSAARRMTAAKRNAVAELMRVSPIADELGS